MGFFRNLFKSKYDKLTREDVVNAICALEQQSQEIEEGLVAKKKRIDDLMVKGKTERDKDTKLLYAKKINALKADRQDDTRRDMYLMYNIRLLQKLKTAIDDNQFFKNTANASLGNLLADQVGLAKFLNKTLGTRVEAENVLTAADETFRSIEEAYEVNEDIYGTARNDDELLAMFETEEQADAEQEMFSEKPVVPDGSETKTEGD